MTQQGNRTFRRLLLICLGLFLAPGFLHAQSLPGTRISASEFEKLSEGRTLHFSQNGVSFGSEQYFPGRRSRWKPFGGECSEGSWHENAEGQICFLYELNVSPACWNMFRINGEIKARAVQATDPIYDLKLEYVGDEVLNCRGPLVGS